MRNRSSLGAGIGAGAIAFLGPALSWAQVPPATPSPAGAEPLTTPARQSAKAGTTPPPAAPSVVAADGPDHEKFTGHFGVTYFGVSQVPVANGNPATLTQSTVNAPVIGLRHWFRREFGLDVGVGLGFGSGSRETQTGNTQTTVDAPSVFAMMFHAGVPIAVAQGKHYTFEIIPEMNLGFATRTVKFPAGAGAQPDITHSGFRFDVGARVGSEIHFGFIGIPELALQASIGLGVSRQTIKVSQDGGAGAFAAGQGGSQSLGSTSFQSTVNGEPWAIFANNISAIYYF
ncbi:MAG: hypothetical protein U0169_16930 [Polyangiaceae bacterium]